MGVAREKAYFLCTLGMKMAVRALWLPKVGGRHGDPLKVITKYGLKTAHICVMTPGPATGHHTTKKDSELP